MKNPLPSVFFILLWQGKDNYAKIVLCGDVRTNKC